MQKIRIQISELSPHNIDCLANDLLLLGRQMDGDVRFELSDDSKSSLFLPSSAASPNSVPVRIPFNDLLSLSADRHYVIFSCTSRSYRIRLRFQDAARVLPKDRFLRFNRASLMYIPHIG